MTSFKHIETLIKKHPEIEVFRFFCFSFSNKVQDRVGPLSLDEKKLIELTLSSENMVTKKADLSREKIACSGV